MAEWECALKNAEDGAREGAEFVKAHIIRVTEKAFDDFAGGGTPGGYLEAFATLYAEAAQAIDARKRGAPVDAADGQPASKIRLRDRIIAALGDARSRT